MHVLPCDITTMARQHSSICIAIQTPHAVLLRSGWIEWTTSRWSSERG